MRNKERVAEAQAEKAKEIAARIRRDPAMQSYTAFAVPSDAGFSWVWLSRINGRIIKRDYVRAEMIAMGEV